MRKWIIGGMALVMAMSPAHADYVYDPADLPEDFECRDPAEEYGKTCDEQKRLEAWYNFYGERYIFWRESMLFRTDIYFAPRVAALPVFETDRVPDGLDPSPDRTPNLIDAHFDIQLRAHGDWAFAIDEKAQMRLVRYKTKVEASQDADGDVVSVLPTNIEEVAAELQIGAAFEEADLTQCDGAAAHLLSFPAQEARPLWDTQELEFAPDYDPKPLPDTIMITMDGAGVYVRTRAIAARDERPVPQVSYRESNRGKVYDWTRKMRAITRPCLKPSAETPPWRKFVKAAERERARAEGN